MGYKTADMPPVDPAEFGNIPFLDRMKLLAIHWCEYGFGSPKEFHMLYIFKLIFYVVGGTLIAWATTPGLGGLFDFGAWWNEPLFYQKLMVWTILFEILGLASSSGPLAFKFGPLIGGCLYWLRPGTIRIAPWPTKIPGTSGDSRTLWDVTLYAALLINVLVMLGMPGKDVGGLPKWIDAGLMNPIPILTYLVLIVVMGFRDKIVFLASRAEQYLPTLLFFALFGFTDMIVGAKIAIVIIWMGAGVSKFGRHTTLVVAPMLSNTPWITSKKFKRALYRDFPNDIRPSRMTSLITHIGGSAVELILPLVLLFSTNRTVTLLAIIGMLLFHAVITSTFPLAVPLEWNVFFMFAVGYLFWNFPAGNGYGVGDFGNGGLLAAVVVGLLFFPVLGNLRPDLVSFLPSMRQYAGNWASASWAFRGDSEDKLNEFITKPALNQVDQLAAAYSPEVAAIFMEKLTAWRSMHSQGPAFLSLMMRHLDSFENYRLREAESTLSTMVGWQFGDGHLLDERLIAAMQKRCNFAPGEFISVHVESQPIHRNYQEYRVIDAALGVVERGTYIVADAADAYPWLPDGPIPYRITWTAPGYTPPEHSPVAAGTHARTNVGPASQEIINPVLRDLDTEEHGKVGM